MQIRDNFDAREFVHPKFWHLHEQGVIDFRWYIQQVTLDMAQCIRDRWGKTMWINTWAIDDHPEDWDDRGLRLPWSNVGATYSQHKYGGAIDFNIEGVACDEVRADIKQNPQTYRRFGLTTIESGEYATSWVHADTRWVDLPDDEIKVVTPSH